jgi:hypothetical protein
MEYGLLEKARSYVSGIRGNDIRQLRSALCALQLGGWEPAAITAALTGVIEQWARGRGWDAFRENDLPGYTRLDSDRGGRLDLYVQPPGRRGIAIEVDRYDREKSLDKLAFCVEQGDLAIWVRWRDGGPATLLRMPPGVELIEVNVGAKPAFVGWGARPAARPHAGGRKAHAHRAYAAWSPEDERRLEQLYRSHVSIPQIARALGRQPGAIRSRLRKRGLSC